MTVGTLETTRGAVLRRAWGNTRLRRVLAAYFLFGVDEWASYVALLVYAYAEGGMRASSAIVLAQVLPGAVLASPAAAMLSRLPTARALAFGYAAQAVSGGLVAAAMLVDLPFAVVAALAAAFSVAITLTRPVHYAYLPEISDTTAELTAGNAGSGIVEAVATLAGPLACAALVVVWSPGGVIVVMAASAVVSAGLVPRPARQPVTEPLDLASTSAPQLGATAQLTEVLRDKPARVLCALVAAEHSLMGMMDILLVVLAFESLGLGDSGPGWLNAAIGLGGLAGAALTFVLVGQSRLAPALLAGAVAAGVPLALTGLVPNVWTAMCLIALVGAGKTFFDVTSRTLVHRLLPDRLLGAVFGVQEALMMAGLAVGSVLAPVLVEVAGLGTAFAVAGLLLPLAVVLALPRLTRQDAAAVVPADVLALLQAVPILAVLPPRLVERLARLSEPEHLPGGAVVVAEGQPGSLFYIVEAGELSVTHGDDELRRLGPGAWFGELALLRNCARTATVTAISDVRLHAVDRDTFLTALAGQARSHSVAREHATEHYR
jgi:MFS family permease